MRILDPQRLVGKALAIALFLSVFVSSGAFAANTDWQGTLAGVNDPVAKKLMAWFYATDTDMPIDPLNLMAFINANPGWPRLSTFRNRIEDTISPAVHPQEIAAWFGKYPPETAKGIRAYASALNGIGAGAQARVALQTFWTKASLGRTDTASLASKYASWLGPHEHAARLEHLLWAERYTEAEYMMPLVGRDLQAYTRARIALGRLDSRAEAILKSVSPQLQNSEGIAYERMRWRRRKNMDTGAMEMAMRMPKNTQHAEEWWKELNILARRRIELHDYKGAYNIASRHALTTGTDYTQAEWLLGWLSLRFARDARAAYGHFEKLYNHVQSSISKSRAAHWAARAAEALPDPVRAKQWDTIAAKYPSTFYGQLSHTKIHGRPSGNVFAEPPVNPLVQQAFDRNETVRAARILKRYRLESFIDPFLARLVDDAKTREDYALVARLAHETGRLYYAVQANKDAQQKYGIFIFTEGYPLLPSVPLQHPEKALVHAIVYRESMFNENARSEAGALGLMQLMPGTAKQVSRNVGERYAAEKLTGMPSYNVLLGSTYLGQMLDRYNHFMPMAIAAYNAGPGRVDQWIEEFGDPRTGRIDVIDWIEMIPIYETRNYVQRVMETYYMYRLRLNQQPKIVTDLVRR